MMMKNNKEFFEACVQSETEKLTSLQAAFSRISMLRALSFVLAVATLSIGLTEQYIWLCTLGCLMVFSFLGLVKYHNVIEDKQSNAQRRLKVCRRYVERFGDGWRSFEDTGREFLEERDCVSADVDLLGEHSLYQLLSVCHTPSGKQKFAQKLITRMVTGDERQMRKAAIRELSEDLDFMIDFEVDALATKQGKQKFKPEEFERFCADEEHGYLPGWANIVRILLPVAELACMVCSVIGLCSFGYALVGFLIVLSFSWLTRTVTDRVILPTYYVGQVSKEYEAMLQLVAQKEFDASLLQNLQRLAKGPQGAAHAFSKLRTIAQGYNLCYNPLLHQLLSGLFLWDYQLASMVGSWKRKYGKNVAGCFSMLGELEELMSFSVLHVIRDVNEAQISDNGNGLYIKVREMYHPLLQPETIQANSVELRNDITIITGSNMSGKTTFLRTLAVNLVLAYLGAGVCAKQCEASEMELFTSMRIGDDVVHGISTFYAEILRIKAMSDYKKKHRPMLCLIDEIFKGTNSADRIFGAREVIRQLADEQCMTIVSTHDFELCEMQDQNGVVADNYHFEEGYEEDRLCFDYKIKPGRCTTRNARAILRMVGFSVPEE